MHVHKWIQTWSTRSYYDSSFHFVLFHSTPCAFAKWRSKWESSEAKGAASAKNYVRYAIRQKRADARKSLKDFLSNATYKPSLQDDDVIWSKDETVNRDGEDVHHHQKKSKRAKAHQNRNKRKWNKANVYSDCSPHLETIIQATFGKGCFTWSFSASEEFNLHNSTYGFEWRNCANQKESKRWWETRETDDNESKSIGLQSERVTLGLPPTGPLTMEDVKNSFRALALKWHPDKHLGQSKEIAEEKFKHYVNAYKSLCSALAM